MKRRRAIDLYAADLTELGGVGRRDLLQGRESLAIEPIVHGEPLAARR